MNNCAAFGLRILIEGDVACFRRPEFASDLVTYDVMPPTVASRLIGACLPGWTARTTHVRVLKPIARRWQTMRTARGIKRCHVLEDVAYVLDVEVGPCAKGAVSGIRALVTKADVHLGLSDFSARVSLLDGGAPPSALDGTGAIDLGWMLYDLKSSRRSSPRFFRAVLQDGVMTIPPEMLAELAA